MKINNIDKDKYIFHSNGLFWLRNDLVFLSYYYDGRFDRGDRLRKAPRLNISIFPKLDRLTNISKIHIIKYNETLTYGDMCELHEFAYILYKIYNRRLIIHITKNQLSQLKDIAEKHPDFKDMDVFTFAVDNGYKINNMNKTYYFTTANKVYVQSMKI